MFKEKLCNCGKEVRYMHRAPDGTDNMSCNKRVICPSYEELYETNKELVSDLFKLLSSAGDVLTYKDSSKYYEKGESVIYKIREKYSIPRK